MHSTVASQQEGRGVPHSATCRGLFRLQVIHLADAFIQSDLQVVQTTKT